MAINKYMTSLSKNQRFMLQRTMMLISLIGCAIQVTQVSIQYFAYKTTTQLIFELREKIEYHSLVLCVRYFSILDYASIESDLKIKMSRVNDLEEVEKQDGRLTIKQIFDYTPAASDVITRGYVRETNETGVIYEAPQVHDYFNVSKYFTQEFMCYKITPTVDNNLLKEAVTLSTHKMFTVYDVTLNQRFVNADVILPLSFTGLQPFTDRSYSHTLNMKKSHESKEQVYNRIKIFPTDYVVNKLEAPYDTMCIRRPLHEYYICRKKCLMEKFEKEFKKTPRTEMIYEPIDLKPLTAKDSGSDGTYMRVRSIYIHCIGSCRFEPCHHWFTKTSAKPTKFGNLPLVVSSMSPTEAQYVTETQATMSFIDYFSFVSGCFSTWFGISFLSLNPLVLVSVKRIRPKSGAHLIDRSTSQNINQYLKHTH